MKPVLVIGLGNTMMGDDGVGCLVAQRLAADPRLPAHVEVQEGGTDLLRFLAQMDGRDRILVVDAFDDPASAGVMRVIDDASDHQEHAHYLSVGQAIKLLRITNPAEFTLLGVGVKTVQFGDALSPEIEDRLPGLVNDLLKLLSR